jgi:hypothetical protein
MEPSNGYIAERVQETKACLHTFHRSLVNVPQLLLQ